MHAKPSLNLDAFLAKERLPTSYLKVVESHFLNLAEQISEKAALTKAPLLVGINGSQGSGKSTLAALLLELLRQNHNRQAINLSIDDFYLTRAERQQLARTIHPLLATRGVPGSHDLALLRRTLEALHGADGKTQVPRFDKGADDRCPVSNWGSVEMPLDVIILEGWCLGAKPQPEHALQSPINALEAREDPHGIWRQHVNAQLSGDYQLLHQQIDFWVMLAAPSFDCVAQWRLEQEQKLAPGPQKMDAPQVARFVQHYQRITEQLLCELPPRVDVLYQLDAQRNITGSIKRRQAALLH